MWISKAAHLLIEAAKVARDEKASVAAKYEGESRRLEIENARLRADLDWFKLRLNQVERERGQLIQAAIGVKIAVPEFVPTYEDPATALNQLPDLSTIGHDAKDTGAEPGEGVDFSMLPGYGRK